MTHRKELSFDGYGINGPDEFRSRICTMNRGGKYDSGPWTDTQLKHYGKLFESAPEMLHALRDADETIAERMGLIEAGELDATETLVMLQDMFRKIIKEFPQ